MNSWRVKVLLVSIGWTLCFVPSVFSVSESSINARRDGLLENYTFQRTVYRPSEIGLLMGNGEMGGMADHAGRGFGRLWLADLWTNVVTRIPMYGPMLTCQAYDPNNAGLNYRQTLDLRDGVLTTRVDFGKTGGYESTMFASMANKNLLIIKIRDLSKTGDRKWVLHLPIEDTTVKGRGSGIEMEPADKDLFRVEQVSPNQVEGISQLQAFTQMAWVAYSSKQLTPSSSAGEYTLSLGAGDELLLLFSVAGHWDGEDFVSQALNALMGSRNFDMLLAANRAAWKTDWERMAVITIPDERFESLFYRSIYWMLCTTGSDKFLQGESQFAWPCWRMQPFTYGTGGWAVRALVVIGHEERARKLAKLHFKPEALKNNAAYFMPEGRKNNRAWCFGCMLDLYGNFFGNQLGPKYFRGHKEHHENGFAASFFHLVSRYYPDEEFRLTYTYPVLRGTAEFWRGMAKWDDSRQAYMLPKMTSVAGERLQKESVQDAVMAAKWTLMMAGRYAEEIGCDEQLRKEWRKISDELYIPQNELRYLEWPDDNETRSAGDGYCGIRGHSYIGYPVCELIPFMDREKVCRTLDKTWQRNAKTGSLISFVASWFALNETHYGRGDQALEIFSANLKCLDPSGTALCEISPDSKHSPFPKPYFGTSYSAYVLVPVSMMLQTYDNNIWAFPAVPSAWNNDMSFYNLPAEAGIRVSGQMKDGEVKWVSYSKDSRELLRLNDSRPVKIIPREGAFELRIK